MSTRIVLIVFLILFFQKIHAQNCGIDSLLCYSYQQYPTVTFSAQQSLQSIPNTVVFQTPLVVDINLDCIPEIIIAGTTGYSNNPRMTSGITILNSVTGATMSSFPTVYYSWSCPSSYVIGDINLDGFPEIIVAAANYTGNSINLRRKLVCYDFSGNVLWISDQTFGNNTIMQLEGSPSLADFNQDGIAEVYVHNQIFNSQTGVLLADGGSNGIGKMAEVQPLFESCLTVAANLDSNPNDLELAAGYTIYKVQIVNITGTLGNIMTPFNIMIDGLYRDGMTSIADINQDGQLDVIIGTEGTEVTSRLYAYYLNNLNVPVLIAKTPMPRGTTAPYSTFTGPPFIGDLDGNGVPSICLTRNHRLIAYSYNGTTTFQQKWIVTTIDQSGCTGITSFDFDQNGIQELVFRDEQNMKIINGNGSIPTTLSVIPCSSPTFNDMAIVADIDNTGTSKICVTCGTNNTAKLRVYSSNGSVPWAPSRKIWNQYGYHVFNVHDDATIPQYQLNNASSVNGERNNFYVQASLLDINGNSMIPASEVSGNINCITNNQITNEINIQFDISNDILASQSTSTGLIISFFNGNPETTGTLIGTSTFNNSISPGDSYSLNFQFPFSPALNGSVIYMVVNNNGLTSGVNFQPQNFGQIECNYLNNIDSFVFVSIDAGQDIGTCGIQPVMLSATNSNGYTGNWQIFSGSGNFVNTFDPNTTFNPSAIGQNVLQWVVEDNACIYAIDNIIVNSITAPQIIESPDTSICIGDSIQIGLMNSTLYMYQWTSNLAGFNSNLEQPFVSPNQNTTYYLEILDSISNCVNFDTLIVTTLIQPVIVSPLDLMICAGDSMDISYNFNSDYSYYWFPFNSTSYNYNGTIDTNTQIQVTITNNLSGCSIIDSISITALGMTSFNTNPVEICLGDNYQILFQSTVNTVYSISYDLINYSSLISGLTVSPTNSIFYLIESVDTLFNCTNLDTFSITVYPNPIIDAGIDLIICAGDTIILNGSGALTYLWNNGVLNNTSFSPLLTNTYTVSGTDSNGCVATDQVHITVNPMPSVNAGADQVICISNSTVLSAISNYPVSWNNGVTDGIDFIPFTSENYIVTVTDNNNCTSTDEVFITVNPLPVVTANGPSFVCIGGQITLSGSGAFTYSWDNNVINGTSFVPQSIITTLYTVVGTSLEGCINSNEISVTVLPLPTVFAGVDTTICFGEDIILNASSQTENMLIWNNTLSSPSIIYPNIGLNTYVIQSISPNGCTNTDTIIINVIMNPIADFLFSPQEIIESNTLISFVNQSVGGIYYSWIFNGTETTNVFSPQYTSVSTMYNDLNVTLIVTNEIGCIDSIDVVIPFIDNPIVYVPNSFTPDGNEFNNSFNIISSGSISENGFELMIFNRWGEIIFESHNLSIGWDGTYNGKIVQDGTYIWKLKYKSLNSEKVYEEIGHLTIIK